MLMYKITRKELQEIELPSLGSVSFNGDKDDEECFFSFTSFTVPGATYKYDVQKNSYELFRAPKVKFNSDDFVTEQVFFTSKDGAKIPMFLTYQKGSRRMERILYSYTVTEVSTSVCIPHSASTASPSLKMAAYTYKLIFAAVANTEKTGMLPEPKCRNKMYLTTS